MRSVHLFAPWVRRIHLVTAGQVPDWLDTDHPQVQVVDHRDILPADALPTFNSHAIETALHRVPDLTEQWVYLNDDVFLGRPLRPEIVLQPGRAVRGLHVADTTVGLDDAPGAPPYLKAAWNNRRLLREAFGVTTRTTSRTRPTRTGARCSTRSSGASAEAVSATARAPFRSDTDVAMLSSLGPALRAGHRDGVRRAGRASGS